MRGLRGRGVRGLWPVAAALGLLLAGCAKPPAPGASLLAAPGKMASLVLFEPARLTGEWVVVASGVPGCAGARQGWAFDGKAGYRLSGVDCSGQVPQKLDAQLALTGPGARMAARMAAGGGAFGGAPVWLLWADADARVAVLGTPGGTFALILARPDVAARGDLIAAAHEVLAFNGYDPAKIGR